MADIRLTPQLTTFVGTDEQPLSDGGRWAQADLAVWVPMARKSNTAVNANTGTLGFSYWTPSTFDDSGVLEVWGVASGGGGGAGGEGWRLGLYQDVGGTNAVDGYSGLFFSAGTPTVIIRKYTNGTFTNLTSIGVGYNAATFLFRRDGNELQWWSSGDLGANWTLDLTASDGTYHGDFSLSLGAEDQGLGQICQWLAFGGGNIHRRTQIYRILKGFDV